MYLYSGTFARRQQHRSNFIDEFLTNKQCSPPFRSNLSAPIVMTHTVKTVILKDEARSSVEYIE